MKKLVVAGGVIGAVVLLRRAKAACGEVNFGQMIERMPEDAPPRWMFRNISEIRDNTERILQLLESGSAPTPPGAGGG